jgi:hypothetical protein
VTSRPVPKLTQQDIARFWSKVNKADSCWTWLASRCGYNYKNGGGYGQFCKGRSAWYAHRVSWTICRGEIVGDLQVLHRCDNPICVRPDHLFLGTQLDNMKDCRVKGREAVGEKKANYGEKNGMKKPGVYEKWRKIIDSDEWREKVSVGTKLGFIRSGRIK